MDDAAACTTRPGLPWVADRVPNEFFQAQMRAVCGESPIRRQCAQYAVQDAPSGFFAGVWIPEGRGRSEALKTLRRIAATA